MSRLAPFLFLLLAFPGMLSAQTGDSPAADGALQEPTFNLLDDLGGPGGLGGPFGDEQLKLTGSYKLNGRKGVLSIEAEIAFNWHLYSITQPKGGPQRSELSLVEGQPVRLTGDFLSDRDPESKKYDFWDVPAEEHSIGVIWSAPIEIDEGVDPAKLKIKIAFSGQVCKDMGACIPQDLTVEASYAGAAETPTDAKTSLIVDGSHGKLEGFITPKQVVPGGKAVLHLRITPEEPYHVYAYEPRKPAADSGALSSPTLIALTKRAGWKVTSRAAPDHQARSETVVEGMPQIHYHEKPVTWTMELEVPADAKPGQQTLEGAVGFQTCTDKTCDEPLGATFQVTLNVGDSETPGQATLQFTTSDYDFAASAAESMPVTTKVNAPPPPALTLVGLATAIGFGLLGGLILNLMPCVLPVIGLKILSFAEQAGQSRGKVLSLNLWFSAGLIAVFLILATLSVFLNLGWGEQFTYTWFKVAMTCLVFAMALSFLGIWEIPLPGFVGAGKSNDLQAKEGASGAFFKGVFTTVLATPCSGPFLGPVFGYTLSQPWIITYVIFLSVGVGMASPYLLVGVFPGLVKYLPKPGAWMETFKQFMAFMLLGTVVFLFTTISSDYFIATLALLVGIWFGCWLIGRTPFTAPQSKKAKAWIGGTLVAVATGYCSFTYLGPIKELIEWKPFSEQSLAEAQATGQVVMVDFTADWCATCKLNLRTAINTQKVSALVEERQVIPLLADWSDRSPEIKESLLSLNSKSIPLLAIYPAGRPEEVIVLRDLIIESQVIAAIEKASGAVDLKTASLR